MQDGACCSRLHVTCVIWAQLESIEVDQHPNPTQSCAHAQCSDQYGALHPPPFLTVPDRNSPSRAGVLTRDTRKVTKGFCLRPTSSMLGSPAARSTVRVSSPDRAPGSRICNQSRGMLRTMAVRVYVCACAWFGNDGCEEGHTRCPFHFHFPSPTPEMREALYTDSTHTQQVGNTRT